MERNCSSTKRAFRNPIPFGNCWKKGPRTIPCNSHETGTNPSWFVRWRVSTKSLCRYNWNWQRVKSFSIRGKLLMSNSTKKSSSAITHSCQTEATGPCHRWRLHHDKAPAHTAFLVTSYLTRIGVEVLPQPPYSLAMTPPDFFLLPKEKRCLKGNRFDDIPNIQRAVTKALTGVTPTDYSGAYEVWKTRRQRCVDAESVYFAKINVMYKSDQ